MKKFFAVAVAFFFVSTHFIGCKKDNNDAPGSNSITITGTFTVGETTFNNATFFLGDPNAHEGYVRPNYQIVRKDVLNMIEIVPVNNIDLGNNIFLSYEYYIFTDTPGSVQSELYIKVLEGDVKGNFMIACYNAPVKITKVDEVGGYIEGTFEGTFHIDKKSVDSYPVKGRFKVKRIEYITK